MRSVCDCSPDLNRATVNLGAPVIVVDDEIGGAEGTLVVDVGQQRRICSQLHHLRVSLHACHEGCLRDCPLQMHTRTASSSFQPANASALETSCIWTAWTGSQDVKRAASGLQDMALVMWIVLQSQ